MTDLVGYVKLTRCLLGNFSCPLVDCRFSLKSTLLFRKTLSEIPFECQTIWGQNGADLGPKCTNRLSADDSSRQRVKQNFKKEMSLNGIKSSDVI